MSKMNLTEATMLALQGKLPMKESKATRKPRNIKKTEAIDVNVDDKTNVSVLDNETIAEKFFWLDAPFIYRVHEKPNEDTALGYIVYINNKPIIPK